jgi:hypothetical protein
MKWGSNARRRWPKSEVYGEGRFAVLTCAFFHTSARQMMYSEVHLFQTLDEAKAAQSTIYCHAATKGRCQGKHEIVDLENWKRK